MQNFSDAPAAITAAKTLITDKCAGIQSNKQDEF
jgi:hypothetical protein